MANQAVHAGCAMDGDTKKDKRFVELCKTACEQQQGAGRTAAEVGEAYVVPLDDGMPLKRDQNVSHVIQALPPNFNNADTFQPITDKGEVRRKLQLATSAVLDAFANLCGVCRQ
jgi:hypothetical protein